MTYDVFRNAAHDQAVEARPVVGAYNDQVGAELSGAFQDAFCRTAKFAEMGHVQVAGKSFDGAADEIFRNFLLNIYQLGI